MQMSFFQSVQPDLFGEADLISAYSRANALEDGALIDVSSPARDAGFRYQVAITQALHAAIEPGEAEKAIGQSYTGRLWDVLWMASLSARKKTGDRFAFQVILAEASPDAPDGVILSEVVLLAICGPGDQAEPVITIGYPGDF